MDMEIVQHAMELTGTAEFASRPVSSLSGGERQRVFIARALSQGAPLLLLDEPTAHLDIGYQPAVLDLIQRIRTDMGVSVLAAMHDISLAAQYCQRIAVLHQGSVYAVGTPEEIITAEISLPSLRRPSRHQPPPRPRHPRRPPHRQERPHHKRQLAVRQRPLLAPQSPPSPAIPPSPHNQLAD